MRVVLSARVCYAYITCNTCIIKTMLTVRLDEETDQQLADTLAHEQTDKSELIRRLIRERWLTLQVGKTIAERRGGRTSPAPPTGCSA